MGIVGWNKICREDLGILHILMQLNALDAGVERGEFENIQSNVGVERV
jgi:hypothetical protein